MDKKMISIIVPVYNVKDYLQSCVQSIQEQTYQNLEIILVDDGSTDGSGGVCDEIAKKDERIKVIHKINGGLSDARNAGLNISTGDYIGFVDSDDTVEEDMYEILVKNLEKYDAGISCCRYTKVWENGERETVGNDHRIHVYKGLEGLKEYFLGKTMDPFVCNKLYKAEYMKGKSFIKGIIGEDVPFNIEVFSDVNTVVLAGESKYNYLQQREGAITNLNVTQKRVDSVYRWNDIRLKCKEKYPQLEKYVLRRQILFYIGLYNRTYIDNTFHKVAKNIREFIKEYLGQVLESNVCEFTVKVSCFLLAKYPWLYSGVMRLYKKIVGEAKL